MHNRTIALLIVVALAGCGLADSRVSNASEIVKESLSSPSSFDLVSGKVMWSGKNAEDKPAYIVRIEYDAQNEYGAMIRHCQLVAYTDNGDKISWHPFFALSNCVWKNSEFGVVIGDESHMVEFSRKLNFEKR